MIALSKIEVWKVPPAQSRREPVHLFPIPHSLNDVSHAIPGGAYTTLRTYQHTRVLPLADQVHRLEDSSRLLGSPVHIELPRLASLFSQALRHFYASAEAGGDPAEDARLRLTLDLEKEPGAFYLAVEPLQAPSPAEFTQGVLVVTRLVQRQNPRAKHTAFIAVADELRKDLPPGANEGLLLDPAGRILEGLSSNFWGVKEGVLWTAAEDILPGITRQILLQIVAQTGAPLHLESLSQAEIPHLSEAFLTSSSRSVLPIRQIDATLIGDGRPGPLTRALRQAFEQQIRSLLVDLE